MDFSLEELRGKLAAEFNLSAATAEKAFTEADYQNILRDYKNYQAAKGESGLTSAFKTVFLGAAGSLVGVGLFAPTTSAMMALLSMAAISGVFSLAFAVHSKGSDSKLKAFEGHLRARVDAVEKTPAPAP